MKKDGIKRGTIVGVVLTSVIVLLVILAYFLVDVREVKKENLEKTALGDKIEESAAGLEEISDVEDVDIEFSQDSGVLSSSPTGEYPLVPEKLRTIKFFDFFFEDKKRRELLGNREFISSGRWIIDGNWKIGNGEAKAGYGKLSQQINLKPGRTYEIKIKVNSFEAKNAYLQPILGGVEGERISSAKPGEIIVQKIAIPKENLVPGSPNYVVQKDMVLQTNYWRGGSLDVSVDYISVKEIKSVVEIERKININGKKYEVELKVNLNAEDIDHLAITEFAPEGWIIAEGDKNIVIKGNTIVWMLSDLLDTKVENMTLKYGGDTLGSNNKEFRGYWEAYSGFNTCKDVIYGEQGDSKVNFGECIPDYDAYCFEDDLYYYDSCGNKQDLKENCQHCVGSEFNIKQINMGFCSNNKKCYDIKVNLGECIPDYDTYFSKTTELIINGEFSQSGTERGREGGVVPGWFPQGWWYRGDGNMYIYIGSYEKVNWEHILEPYPVLEIILGKAYKVSFKIGQHYTNPFISGESYASLGGEKIVIDHLGEYNKIVTAKTNENLQFIIPPNKAPMFTLDDVSVKEGNSDLYYYDNLTGDSCVSLDSDKEEISEYRNKRGFIVVEDYFGDSSKLYDECLGNSLKEYSCDGSSKDYKITPCNCYDGRCVNE